MDRRFFVVHVWRDARGASRHSARSDVRARRRIDNAETLAGIWPCTLRYRRRPNRTDPVKQ